MIRQHKHVFIYGFAIFAMFFGSGNLVFPLQIGQESGHYWLIGFLGLFVTGILLPFLGLFVIKLHRGSYTAFFSEAGTLAQVALPFFTLSLIGAFGVVPRCITVAHGSIGYIFPHLSLGVFSFLFCVACFLISVREHFMITVLGKWMTPFLLISLIVLIVLGVIHAPSLISTAATPSTAFENGFLIGYQTMDLFAAFFFSSLIFKQIQGQNDNMSYRDVLKVALKPSLIGCFLLTAIYFGFVFLGAQYKFVTTNVSPELILPTIAAHLMGVKSVILIGLIVLFSCLTTAIALNNIYATYLCSLFKLKDRWFLSVLFITTSLSFFVSLLDFRGIAAFLTPLLKMSYPSLILLTLMSIFLKDYKKLKISVFYGVLTLMIVQKYFG